MFSNPIAGNGFAMSRVESYRRSGKGEIEVTLVGGEVHRLDEGLWHSTLGDTIQAAFAAQPNTFLVEELSDGEKVVDVLTLPILGFAIDAVGIVKPVTVQGLAEDNDVVLHPDGRVFSFDAGPWESLDDYRKEVVGKKHR